MSLADFLEYRNKELSQVCNRKGYYIFPNALAEAIYILRPHCINDLVKIPGIPSNGEICKKYGDLIVKYFNESDTFSKR